MPLNESLWEFPVDYVLKVVGREGDQFKSALIEIIQRYVADFDPKTIQSKPSSNGKYVSLTAKIYLTDKSQVLGIYRDLNACQEVLWAL